MTPTSGAYQQIKDTLDSPGMKHIRNALHAYHKAQWKAYRQCRTEVDLAKIQTAQHVIDTVIPAIIEGLMNKHIPPQKHEDAKRTGEWWKFWEWFKRNSR